LQSNAGKSIRHVVITVFLAIDTDMKTSKTSSFYRAACMQTRSSDENSVGLSVCLSVCQPRCDKTKESCARIFIPHEKSFTLVL